MENFKFILSSIIIIGLLGGAGYWAFSTIESGSTHVDVQKQKEIEQKNKDLEKEIINLKKEISLLEADKEQAKVVEQKVETPIVVEAPVVTPPVVATPKVTVSKNQALIDELQKLVNNKVYLKLKSQGAYVGTVQKFLNLYNKTSNHVDNDYGASTVTAVKNYQKAVGITADGETGPTTYTKMISWLKSH